MAAHSNHRTSPPPSDSPRPLESLHETPIPPFLSKAYDLVDDPSLDAIISWGHGNGNSFVVWEPVEFARTILPRNFKHNNFSSFVRQLNTYGFRKIDTDKWEFTNEGFVRGQRHLLRRIRRRRSHQSPHLVGLSSESGKAVVDGEIRGLRRERSLMMQEVIELQHQQLGTVKRIDVVKEKLDAAERRQKQLISFLARMFDKPAFLAHLSHQREQKSIAPPRAMRRFVKHRPDEPGALSGAENRVEDGGEQDALAMVSVPTFMQPQDGVMNHPPPQFADDEFVMENGVPEILIPGNESGVSDNGWSTMMMEKGVPELSMVGEESMVSEDARRMGLEDPWCCVGSYDGVDLGFGNGVSDISEAGLMQVGESSGINWWLDEQIPFN